MKETTVIIMKETVVIIMKNIKLIMKEEGTQNFFL